jgi:hypothetical protein
MHAAAAPRIAASATLGRCGGARVQLLLKPPAK